MLLKFVADVDRSLPVLFIDTGWLFEETLVYRDELVSFLANHARTKWSSLGALPARAQSTYSICMRTLERSRTRPIWLRNTPLLIVV